jgi:glycosyltransferase involved in cell wall biosynthesis
MAAAVRAGHEAVVFCTNRDAMHGWRGNEPDVMFDGVRIVRVRNSIIGAQRMKSWKPDVVVSHHQHALQAIKTARLIGARSVYFSHNAYDLNRRPIQANPSLIVHNSIHVQEALSKFSVGAEEMVFHPPLTPERHLVESTGDAYTLINMNADKGSELFYRLAEAEPDRKFVGVVGGHGVQVIKRNIPNVTILEHGPDMQRVWSLTRVLLMPSEFESYGLTAVEAGINGIPTIAHPTPGLQENLGPEGMYADRDNLSDWRMSLEWLDDPENYAMVSKHASGVADAAMKETRDTLKKWVEWIG